MSLINRYEHVRLDTVACSMIKSLKGVHHSAVVRS